VNGIVQGHCEQQPTSGSTNEERQHSAEDKSEYGQRSKPISRPLQFIDVCFIAGTRLTSASFLSLAEKPTQFTKERATSRGWTQILGNATAIQW
jgi:hypothetical protein